MTVVLLWFSRALGNMPKLKERTAVLSSTSCRTSEDFAQLGMVFAAIRAETWRRWQQLFGSVDNMCFSFTVCSKDIEVNALGITVFVQKLLTLERSGEAKRKSPHQGWIRGGLGWCKWRRWLSQGQRSIAWCSADSWFRQWRNSHQMILAYLGNFAPCAAMYSTNGGYVYITVIYIIWMFYICILYDANPHHIVHIYIYIS